MTHYSLFILLITLLLNACNQNTAYHSADVLWEKNIFLSYKQFANRCHFVRDGTDPITHLPYPDQKGQVLDENNWLRAWSNHFYLWYDEIIDKDPALYNTSHYFQTLKSLLKLPSGTDKGRFHYQINSAEYFAFINEGKAAGYGAEIASISSTVPRHYVFLYTEPGSPASKANIKRGSRIIAIDGIDLINTKIKKEIDHINQALSPSSINQSHTFIIQPPNSTKKQSITLKSSIITRHPVNIIKAFSHNNNTIGYLLFNEHIKTAENQLINAIKQLKSENINDLILDLRYNSGGIVYIANQLSYMIAGKELTNNKTFLTYQYNNKHPNVNPFTNKKIKPQPFYNITTNNHSLPSLNLKRLYVLTSQKTCSASELLINALRGIDIDVIQIGTTTCGKPYAATPTSNCGSTYLSINMQANNHKGFGYYPDGLSPSNTNESNTQLPGCIVADDIQHPLGDPEEHLLATALYYRDNNTCPTHQSAKNIDFNVSQSMTKAQWMKQMIELPINAH